MLTVTLSYARTHLSGLLHRVDDGEDVVITRHGQPIARVSAVPRQKRPLRSLREMPAWSAPSAALLRIVRDEE